MQEKMFLIPETLRAGLLEYLQSRPYKEVAQGVNALMALREATPPEKKSSGDPAG